MQWYGVDLSGPVASSDVEQVEVTEASNPLPSYLFEVLQREINSDSISMDSVGHKYVLVRAFVHTFSDI